MDWRKLWSMVSDIAHLLLMVAAVAAAGGLAYVMALSRMHRH